MRANVQRLDLDAVLEVTEAESLVVEVALTELAGRTQSAALARAANTMGTSLSRFFSAPAFATVDDEVLERTRYTFGARDRRNAVAVLITALFDLVERAPAGDMRSTALQLVEQLRIRVASELRVRAPDATDARVARVH